MEKLYYAVAGWIAFNVVIASALLNRRSDPHTRHRLARWVMSAPRSLRRQHFGRRQFAHALVAAAHCHH
jgi:hypothetical protein